MNRSLHLTALFAIVAALPSLSTAQSVCSTTNLLANGEFDAISNFTNPWSSTNPLSFPQGAKVSNSTQTPNAGMEITGDFTVTQPTTFHLDAGVTYVFGCDAQWMTVTPLRRGTLELLIQDQSQNTIASSIRAPADNSGKRSHIAASVIPTTSGPYTLSIVRSSSTGHVTRIDNAFVRPDLTALSFEGARIAGAATTLRVEAAPNSNFAVFFSIGGILPAAVPLAIPCAGGFGLGGSPRTLLTGATDVNGEFTVRFGFPASAAGVPIGWQTVALPPTCSFGCARILAYD